MTDDPQISRNVCGLLFTTEEHPRVLLAHRDIEGKAIYDGLGGEIEPDARPNGPQIQLSEMVYSETGISTNPDDWIEIVNLRGDTWEVSFYFTHSAAAIDAHSQGSKLQDDISFENPDLLPLNIVPTMKWLIPLALDDSVHKPLGIAGISL